MYGDTRGADRVLVGKPEGKRPLRRLRPRWGYNIEKGFKTWNGTAWTGLMWLRTGTGGWILWML
jgi:hypothetical protein